jgi:hypothetical protein
MSWLWTLLSVRSIRYDGTNLSAPILVCCKRCFVCFYGQKLSEVMKFTHVLGLSTRNLLILGELYLSGRKCSGKAGQDRLVRESLDAPQYQPGMSNWKRPEPRIYRAEESLLLNLHKNWTLSRCTEFYSVWQPWILKGLCKTGGEVSDRTKPLPCALLLSLSALSPGTRALLALIRHYEPKSKW